MPLIKDVARKAAEQVLAEHWDGTLPVDPARIALNLGMGVFTADLDEDLSGLIIKESATAPAQIYLNRDEPPARQNFTCAHELGHWFDRDEHRDDRYSFVDRRDSTPNDSHEWFAEHFAGNLLMPAKPFIAAFDNGLTDSELARRFAVSPAAIRTRIRGLRLRRE
jgi:Zn-dependent peptidase ImmA (M78 family)